MNIKVMIYEIQWKTHVCNAEDELPPGVKRRFLLSTLDPKQVDLSRVAPCGQESAVRRERDRPGVNRSGVNAPHLLADLQIPQTDVAVERAGSSDLEVQRSRNGINTSKWRIRNRQIGGGGGVAPLLLNMLLPCMYVYLEVCPLL